MVVKPVIEERIIWPATFSSIKELYSNVQLRAVTVNLHIYHVYIDTWKNAMKVKLLLKNVRSSLFALKMDVEKFSDMPLNCISCQARLNRGMLYWTGLLENIYQQAMPKGSYAVLPPIHQMWDLWGKEIKKELEATSTTKAWKWRSTGGNSM